MKFFKLLFSEFRHFVLLLDKIKDESAHSVNQKPNIIFSKKPRDPLLIFFKTVPKKVFLTGC